MSRTLYLKLVPRHLVEKMWDIERLVFSTDIIELRHKKLPHVIVRCNKKGDVNWNSTGIYTFDELVGKKIQFVQ